MAVGAMVPPQIDAVHTAYVAPFASRAAAVVKESYGTAASKAGALYVSTRPAIIKSYDTARATLVDAVGSAWAVAGDVYAKANIPVDDASTAVDGRRASVV